MECTVANRNLVPLSKAVSAAIIDKYENVGKTEQRFTHWAGRELKQLYTQILPKLKQRALLEVNVNTKTATLPLDFAGETFVGAIDENWQKIPLRVNNQLVDVRNITNIPCEDACPKCQQDTGICNDLTITEDTEIIVINDTPYNKTIIKKLYPNGDYYLETTTPVLNIEDDEIEYAVKKEFITNFDLRPCGCLDNTPENIVTLQAYCPDVYCNYYSTCGTPCNSSYGGYKIFEETGLIQFDVNFPYSRVYLEYNGYIQKIKGKYYVPEVAFECLVEGIKRRAIKDKPNVTQWQIIFANESYKTAKRDLQRILGRVSLSQIVQAISMIPKFDIDFGYNYYGCFASSTVTVPATSANIYAASLVNGGGSGGGSGSGSGPCSIVNNNYITINNHGNYTLAVKVDGNPGSPVAGATSYQNNILIGATNITYIIVAKAIETIADGDFTFDPNTGTIDRSPNQFVFGDTLIVNYDKNS